MLDTSCYQDLQATLYHTSYFPFPIYSKICLPSWEVTGTHFNRKEQVRDVETQTLSAKNPTKPNKQNHQNQTWAKLRDHENPKEGIGWLAGKLSKNKGQIFHLKITQRNTPKVLYFGIRMDNSSFLWASSTQRRQIVVGFLSSRKIDSCRHKEDFTLPPPRNKLLLQVAAQWALLCVWSSEIRNYV